LPLPFSKRVKSKIINISYPIVKISNSITNKISRTINNFADIFDALEENKKLKKKIANITQDKNKIKEIIEENKRLKKIVDLGDSIEYETIICRIIGRDASNWFRTLILNKGTESGIRSDMPVISLGAVIGRVINYNKNTSTVLLITDTNSSIGGLIQNTRIAGLVEGNGSSDCDFNYISKQADINIGDNVITSGLGNIFPKGFIIGKIIKIKNDSQDLYKIATVKLATNINRIEEVIVIKNSKK